MIKNSQTVGDFKLHLKYWCRNVSKIVTFRCLNLDISANSREVGETYSNN